MLISRVVSSSPKYEGKKPVTATPSPKTRIDSAERRCSLTAKRAKITRNVRSPGTSRTDWIMPMWLPSRPATSTEKLLNKVRHACSPTVELMVRTMRKRYMGCRFTSFIFSFPDQIEQLFFQTLLPQDRGSNSLVISAYL